MILQFFYDEPLTDKEKIKITLDILDELNEEIPGVDLKVLRKDEEGYFLKMIKDFVRGLKRERKEKTLTLLSPYT
ncbi:hypothetical protein [Sulfurisphaera javensis]|uniref:hypothetical protein n=1 Tax=Sulfurisphaera javensis TaxID=2049879 RepID=UPI0034E871B2